MKSIIIIGGMLFQFFAVQAQSNFFNDYIKDNYRLHVVKSIPLDITNPILIMSTRHVETGKDFRIKRGLDPDYGIFLFIAGIRNDSAFVMPLEDLTEAIPFLSPQKDFLVYVDGHGKTFGQAMDRGFEIASRFNINMVVFDWPSDYLALRKTVYNTDEVSVNFLKAMRNLDGFHQRYYRSSAVSVLFHSMGNRIIKSVSHPKLLGKMPKQLFSNIIINAAAVKMQNHTKWVERLNIQQRIYITMNDRDMTLKGAALLRMARQLGNGKPDRMAENASYINFGKFPTAEHNLFLGKSKPEINIPQIFLFYQLVFHGREIKLTENVSF